MSFRHVVLFRWADDASPDQRAGAVEALRAFGREAADPRHLAVLSDHVRPIVAQRVAVQYDLDA